MPDHPPDIAALAGSAEFFERSWVLDGLDDRLDDPGERVVLLTGTPGAGKTAIASRIVQISHARVPDGGRRHIRAGAVAHAQFCRARDDRTLDPLRWVKAVVAELGRLVPGYAAALVAGAEPGISIVGRVEAETVATGATVAGVLIQKLDLGNLRPRVAFQRCVVSPLEQVEPAEPLLLVVDGLDETMDYQESEGLVDLLAVAARSLNGLPQSVRLLATSRPDERVLGLLPHVALDLTGDAPQGRNEVADYINLRLGERQDDGRVGARVARSAGGNFLYASLLADELLADPSRLDARSMALPATLAAYFGDYLERELTRHRRWNDGYRQLLGTLAVARGVGLTASALSGATGLSPSETYDALSGVSQYLDGHWADGPFRLYHESFRQFLVENPRHPVFPHEASAHLATFLLERYDGQWLAAVSDEDPTGRYALEHAPSHLLEAAAGATRPADRDRCLGRIQQLLADVRFLEAKTRATDVDRVLEDFERVRQACSMDESLSSLHRVLDRAAHTLRGWDAEELPALFAQLMHLHASDLGNGELAASSAHRLEEIGAAAWWRFVWARGPAWNSLLRTISMHGAEPTAVSITPNGRVCAAGDRDGRVRGWEVDTGRELWAVHAHASEVIGLAACREWVVSCSADGSVVSVAIDDGQVRQLDDGGRPVSGVTATLNGELALGIAADGVLSWDLTTGRLTRLSSHGSAFRPPLLGTRDGTTLLFQPADNIRMLDFGEDRSFSFDGWDEQRRLWVAAPMPDGRSILCFYEAISGRAKVDLSPEVNEVSTDRLLQRLEGPTFAYGAAVAATGSWAASYSLDEIVIWDLHRGCAVGRLPAHNQNVVALAPSPRDPLLISAGRDRTLRLWDISRATALDEPPVRDIKYVNVLGTPEVAAATYRNDPRAAWTLEEGTPLEPDAAHGDEAPPNSLDRAPSADGRRVAQASWKTPMFGMFTWSEATGEDSYIPARIEVHEAGNGEQIVVIEDPRGPLTALAMTASGERVLSASWDGTVSVWRVEGGSLERHLPVGAATARVTLVSRGRAAGEMLDTLVAANAAATALAVTSDDHVIVATRDGSLQDWDLAAGELLAATVLEAPAVSLAVGGHDACLLIGDERGRVTCLARIGRPG